MYTVLLYVYVGIYEQYTVYGIKNQTNHCNNLTLDTEKI